MFYSVTFGQQLPLPLQRPPAGYVWMYINPTRWWERLGGGEADAQVGEEEVKAVTKKREKNREKSPRWGDGGGKGELISRVAVSRSVLTSGPERLAVNESGGQRGSERERQMGEEEERGESQVRQKLRTRRGDMGWGEKHLLWGRQKESMKLFWIYPGGEVIDEDKWIRQ